jgi:hypothetical protein
MKFRGGEFSTGTTGNFQPELTVLMVGGFLEDDRLQYRMALERFEVFPKPYTSAQLIEKVKEVLGNVDGKTQ